MVVLQIRFSSAGTSRILTKGHFAACAVPVPRAMFPSVVEAAPLSKSPPKYHRYSNPFLEKSQSCVFNLLLFFSVSGFGVLFTHVVEILVIVCGLSNSSFVLLQAYTFILRLTDAQRCWWRIIRQADHVGKTYTNYIGIKIKSPPNDRPSRFCLLNLYD